MRTPVIAGNWKMNMTPEQAVALIEALKPVVADAKCTVVACVPYVDIPAAAKAVEGSNIHLGAQNMHFEAKGAYTGEISAEMLTACQVEYVILGHSERRQYFAETDETVNKKLKAALAAGLKPIVCVGETLDEREGGITEQVVETQTKAALEGLDAKAVAGLIIAYEPVWAIGTGRTATAQDANQVIGFIRNVVAKCAGQDAADKVVIQYGGSMNPANATELMAMPEIDGGLIGGASLKAEDFSAVVHF